MVAAGSLLACVLTGLVPSSEAFAGFGHPAVITLACVLVLSRGLQTTSAVPKEDETTDELAKEEVDDAKEDRKGGRTRSEEWQRQGRGIGAIYSLIVDRNSISALTFVRADARAAPMARSTTR